VALRGPEQAVREAVRVVGQVGQVADPMPPNVAAPELAASKRSMGLAERDHLLDEAEMIRMGYLARPVQPCRLVVLVIWVIVAALGLQELVARGEHRNAVGEQQQADQVLRLPLA